MRITFVAHPRIGLNVGGLQQQISHTARALEGLGHHVSRWDMWEGLPSPLPDVAHFFSTDSSQLAVLRAFARAGVPCVLSPVLGTGKEARFVTRVKRTLADRGRIVYQDLRGAIALTREATAVIALTETERELCELWGRTGPIHIVPNGVDSVFELGRPEEGKRRVGHDRYILHVGQFWPNKGQDWLIKHTPRDVHLVLVGGPAHGPGNDRYWDLCARLARDANVTMLGHIEPSSQVLADLYAGADVLVLNSRSEVMPLVLSEAAVSGTSLLAPEHLPRPPGLEPLHTFRFHDPRSYQMVLKSVLATRPRTMHKVCTWSQVGEMVSSVYERCGS